MVSLVLDSLHQCTFSDGRCKFQMNSGVEKEDIRYLCTFDLGFHTLLLSKYAYGMNSYFQSCSSVRGSYSRFFWNTSHPIKHY